jgi:DNA invertase Pin-like site-specific DNA recombinase
MKKVAIYARVSTDGQTSENQLLELRAVADRNGWVVVDEYVDHAISGAKGRDQRPALDAMLTASVRKDFDIVMAWSVDRLGRSLQHLVSFLGEIHAKGVDLYLHQQGLDTSTPAGKAMFQMLGVFSEFEREMIRDRVKSGLARAKAKGRVGGRPRLPIKITKTILNKHATGLSIRKIAKEIGVGVSTVQRTVKAHVVSPP